MHIEQFKNVTVKSGEKIFKETKERTQNCGVRQSVQI